MNPIKLYAYLNIDNPMVAWEVSIGRIKSICHDNQNKFGVSLWFYSLAKMYSKDPSSIKVANEFNLEYHRYNNHKDKVSRLTGVYFFESKQMAEIAIERWKLPLKHKEYITEVDFYAENLTYVDSEWITDYLGSSDQSWFDSYWNGETLGENPLTEVISSGIGLINNENIKKLAYEKILDNWPNSSLLLNSCIVSFKLKNMHNIGLSMPALIKEDGDIKGTFYIDMNDFNNRELDICDAVNKSKGLFNLKWIRPENPDVIFNLCDWTDLNFTLSETNTILAFDKLSEL